MSSGAGIWLSPADTVVNAPQKGKEVPRWPEKWGKCPRVSSLPAGEAQHIGLTTRDFVRHQTFGLPFYTYRWEICRVCNLQMRNIQSKFKLHYLWSFNHANCTLVWVHLTTHFLCMRVTENEKTEVPCQIRWYHKVPFSV